jgi:hypothetical protein
LWRYKFGKGDPFLQREIFWAGIVTDANQDEGRHLLEKGTLIAVEEVKGGFFFVLKQKFKAILHLN